MIDERERIKVYRRAWRLWGEPAQLTMVLEECAELCKVVCKHLRGHMDIPALVDEIADVRIMLEQIVECEPGIDEEQVRRRMEEKLKRVVVKLDRYEANANLTVRRSPR